MDPRGGRADTRDMNATTSRGGTMKSQLKHAALAVCGLAVASAAIMIGLGFVGGAGSSRSAAKVSGPWRSIPDAPAPIAAGRTAVWTGQIGRASCRERG